MGRKIQPQYENPIDNYIIDVCDMVLPIFRNWNWTPNMITTLSNVSNAIGLYSMYLGYPLLFFVFMILGYFFDCLDGHFARTYDMCTLFGDYYDHISDLIGYILFAYLFIAKFGWLVSLDCFNGVFWSFICIAMISLTAVHIGCQEKIHETNACDSQHSHSLTWCKWLTFEEHLRHIQWTRYFGFGSLIMFFLLLTTTLLAWYNSN